MALTISIRYPRRCARRARRCGRPWLSGWSSSPVCVCRGWTSRWPSSRRTIPGEPRGGWSSHARDEPRHRILLSLALTASFVSIAIEVALAPARPRRADPWRDRYQTLRTTTWDATGTGSASASWPAAGVVLLFLQVWRRRPVALPLDQQPQFAPATVHRRQLERALTGDTSHIDGVASSRVKAKRRRVEVDARTNRINPGDLEQRLYSTVEGASRSLGPWSTSTCPSPSALLSIARRPNQEHGCSLPGAAAVMVPGEHGSRNVTAGGR